MHDTRIFNAAISCNPPLKSQMIMAQDSLVAPLISRFMGLKPECKFVVIKFPSLKTIVLKCLSYVSFKLIICNRLNFPPPNLV
jgi:hypothetical protein